jgi:hypothetical protein
MSDTIQNAEFVVEAIWQAWLDHDVPRCKAWLEADRAAHIALGREMERTAIADEARRAPSQYDKLVVISNKECLCSDTAQDHCESCKASHALNEIAEIIRNTLADLEATK